MDTARKERPRLRGVSHQIAFFFSAAVGAGLLTVAAAGRPTVAAAIYVVTLLGLFGISALYHRVTWSEKAHLLMRRVDHSAIFLFIAGTGTPIGLLAMEPEAGRRFLTYSWAAAALGISRAILWPRAPKPFAAATYLAAGWIAAVYFDEMYAGVGPFGMATLVAGGLLYSLGALVYALRRPDPLPTVFGYHEVFHIFVIAACALHFLTIASVVTQAGA